MKKVEDFFARTKETILADYEKSKLVEHHGLKGAAREIFIGRFLEDFFPKKFVIDSGEIIDSEDHVSPQADIVAYDESMPILSHGRGVKQFLAEGVLAHIEVKTSLDSAELLDAYSKCSDIQKLKYSLDSSMHFGDLREKICSFVVGYEGISKASFKESVMRIIQENPDFIPPKGVFNLSAGYCALIQPDGSIVFLEPLDRTLALLFVQLNDALWKNWAGYPNLSMYLDSPTYKTF